MKVRVTTEKTASMQIEVVEAGRGEWKVQKHLDYGCELTGFGGETCLYVFFTYWQSGHCHAVVVRTSCDDRTKIAEELVKSDILDDTLNRLIVDTGIDD